MPHKNIALRIDANSRSIEYCVIEGIDLNPDHYFRFHEGFWVAKLDNFPVQNDNDLDILIVVTGNPGENSSMDIASNEQPKATVRLFRPFNPNGYAQFNTQIPV